MMIDVDARYTAFHLMTARMYTDDCQPARANISHARAVTIDEIIGLKCPTMMLTLFDLFRGYLLGDFISRLASSASWLCAY